MNETISTKYGFAPETIEKRSLDQKEGPYLNEIYDFVRLRKVEKNEIRNAKYNQKLKGEKNFEKPIKFIRKVFALAERLKNKDAPSKLFKASTENMPFLNGNRIFTIYERTKLNNGNYLYWVEKDGKKINGRFLRQELFVINNQFEK